MKVNLNEVAVFETRAVSDAANTGCSTAIRYQRGWWQKKTNKFLGPNRQVAEDAYCLNNPGCDSIEWVR